MHSLKLVCQFSFSSDIYTIHARKTSKLEKSNNFINTLGREQTMICGNPLLCSIHVPHSFPLLFVSKLFGPMNCLLVLSKLFVDRFDTK